MSTNLETLKNRVYETLPAAEELLRQVVNTNSFSSNKGGVDQVGAIFRHHFEELGFETTVIQRTVVGDILDLTNSAFRENGKGGFLFLSHMDTVFPPDGNKIPFIHNNGVYRGNGSTDDKGGAVIAWQVLSALKATGVLPKIPVRVLLNTDEETGSEHSKEVIIQAAKEADTVFCMEYGKPRKGGATVVTSRLGRGTLRVALNGPGAEAVMLQIMENAYYLGFPEDSRVLRLRDFEKAQNACKAVISFGFPNEEEGDDMHGAIRDIITKTCKEKGLAFEVSGGKTRPPLVFNNKRWQIYSRLREIGRKLNFAVYPEHRVSCSDGSFVPDDVNVLDGIGPVGDNVHTDEEYMIGESLTMRPLLLAALIDSTVKSQVQA